MSQGADWNDNQKKDFATFFPPVQISNKHYSLEADIATGWRPKMKILGPIPFNFDAPLQDQIIDRLTTFGNRRKQRVIYLGNRFTSSFKLQQQMPRQYQFKYEGAINGNYSHMAAYFRKFHANFKPKQTRLFRGMNPTIKNGEQLIFDSNFESGNLDAVVRVGENEYDLFIRIDTNTRGHLQWFNFTVKNCGKKKIKFNIVNFKKAKTLYQRGMKPYVYSYHLLQTKELGWFQGGQNVRYFRRKLQYDFLDEDYDEDYITFNCLQFDYTFEVDWEEVQFAYSPPFTYSDTIKMVQKLKQIGKNGEECFVKEQTLCQSLGGLEIPLLTITDPQIDDRKKKCILVSSRIHPGESCGSFMSRGLLQYICGDTEQARYLRKNIVFKIIPMINPDGVVVGNFRTSLCGRDLNRAFKSNNDLLIPEVKGLKQIVYKLKNQFKNRLIFFLDFHGHSVKKNVFLYGPEYDIWETNYYKTRIFPKLISAKTDVFRYYSCLFRVAEFKKTTARAVVLKSVPHCYTIEASTGFYYCANEKRDIPFTPQKWMMMGKSIAECLKDYLEMIYEQEASRLERKQKIISLKTMKNSRRQSKKQSNIINSNKFQTRIVTILSNKSKSAQDQEQQSQMEPLSRKARQIIESIKNDDKKWIEENKKEQGHDSDSFSQGGSDSEQSDDIPEEELNHLHQDILKSMQQYRQQFYKQKEERQSSVKQKKKIKQKDDTKFVKEKGVQLMASLRKKAEEVERARQVLVWNRIKQQFKQIRGRKVDEGRNTVGVEGFKRTAARFRSRGTFGIVGENGDIDFASDFRGQRR